MRAKSLGPQELAIIRRAVNEHNARGRTFISIKVCEELKWFQPNGQPQGMAARDILRRLEVLGLISLPAPKRPANNEAKRLGPGSQRGFSGEPLIKPEGTLQDWGPAVLERVQTSPQSRLFRNLIAEHHYLGYAPMVGRSLKYFIHLKGILAGAISWGSPCWKLGPRDRWIGWDESTRKRNLQGIAGNHRFLILPWVKVKNLASHALGLAARTIPQDWLKIYGIPLNLLESFVDPSRFKGTCYKAANWIYLGQSQGSSKSGDSYRWHGQVKDIYVLPLVADFREKLCRP